VKLYGNMVTVMPKRQPYSRPKVSGKDIQRLSLMGFLITVIAAQATPETARPWN
jgi:hypothetical protein